MNEKNIALSSNISFYNGLILKRLIYLNPLDNYPTGLIGNNPPSIPI